MAERVDPPSLSASDSTPAERLERLLRSNACIPYHENLPDKEYPAAGSGIPAR